MATSIRLTIFNTLNSIMLITALVSIYNGIRLMVRVDNSQMVPLPEYQEIFCKFMCVFITLNCITLLSIFFGCWMGLKEQSNYNVCAYLMSLITLGILHTLAIDWLGNNRQSLTRRMHPHMQKAWCHDRFEPIEIEFECCGIKGVNDYVATNRTMTRKCFQLFQYKDYEQLDIGCEFKMDAFVENVFDVCKWTYLCLICLEIVLFLLMCDYISEQVDKMHLREQQLQQQRVQLQQPFAVPTPPFHFVSQV